MDHADQILPLAGVMLGGVMSFVAIAITERAQWRRQSAVRWDQQRLATYVEFSNACKVIGLISSRMALGRGLSIDLLPGSLVPIDASDGDRALAEAELRRSVAFEGVHFLGDPASVQAGQELNVAVWRLAAASRSENLDNAKWRDAYTAFRAARQSFYQVARSDLRVPMSATDHHWPTPQWDDPPG